METKFVLAKISRSTFTTPMNVGVLRSAHESIQLASGSSIVHSTGTGLVHMQLEDARRELEIARQTQK
jgi:hypothetical protein